eukprot:GILJ01004100.1.p1 GENE.GILJ01004100.1~~GILJ01004100.1.p1  ORF type:complete len:377 (-),score=66.50 GILJ01004100.1:203-1333(-)
METPLDATPSKVLALTADALEKVLALIESDAKQLLMGSTAELVTRENVKQTCDIFVHQLTKLVAGLSHPPLPDLATTHGVCDTLYSSAVVVCSTLSALLAGAKAGAILQRKVVEVTTNFIRNIQNVLRHLADRDSKPSESYMGKNAVGKIEDVVLNQLTGMALDTCKSLEKIPLSNKVAVNHVMLGLYATVNDAYKEMADVIEQHGVLSTPPQGNGSDQQQQQEHSEENEDEDDEDIFDELGEEHEYSAEERQRVKPIATVFETSARCLKQLMHCFSKYTDVESASATVIEYFDTCVSHAKVIASAVDELGSAIYPPQDVDQLSGHYTELCPAVWYLLEQLRSNNYATQEDRDWTDQALYEMTVSRDALKELGLRL